MHTLEQLSAFVHVYDNGSYSSAAKKLGKSRTTVRELVLAYEDLLGYDLFEIDGRKAIPTEKAVQLYVRAKVVEKQNRSLFVQSQSLFDSDVHTINILYDLIAPNALMVHIEQKVRQMYPNITINWLHRTRNEAMEQLISGECDIALLPVLGKMYPDKEVTWRNACQVDLACYSSPDSSLASIDNLNFEHLMAETQYITENILELNSGGIQTHISPTLHKVSNSDLLCQLLKNDGWAVMPTHYMEPYVQRKELIKLSLDELGYGRTYAFNAFHCRGKENIEIFANILDWISKWKY